LGDAYWQVGRKLEAKYQWQRVLSLQPDDDVDLAEINAKIRRGLAKKDPEQLAQDS
jgi:cytochrome c-type biogenesis protein CcmH/NrfG